jgi:hypothetical protein
MLGPKVKRVILLTVVLAAGTACAASAAGQGPAVSQPVASAQPAAAVASAAASTAPAGGLPQRSAEPTPVTTGDLGPAQGIPCPPGPKPDQVICPVGNP